MTESSGDSSGDSELADLMRARLGSRHPVAAVATVAGGEARMAVLGASLDPRFEIGSITKGFTGLLYADAVERNEVTPTTTLGELLPLGECPAAGVSLASLATHTSGLPRLAPSPGLWRRNWNLVRWGANPYGDTLEQALADVRRAQVRAARHPRYSNLGFQLLGHAIASAAGSDYASLLRDRIAAPLSLESFAVPALPSDLTGRDLLGQSPRGRVMEAWTGEAIAPAGGIRSTIGDMAAIATALLDGSAPGVAALDPVVNMSGPAARIGAAWITLESKGRMVTWHNGGTGGFRSWMGLDREARTGVVVLSATAASVDSFGLALLHEQDLASPGRPYTI